MHAMAATSQLHRQRCRDGRLADAAFAHRHDDTFAGPLQLGNQRR
jgi:hypothetical protein